MEGFKSNQKMKSELACFREGGSVGVNNAFCGGGKAYRKGGEVHDKADMAEDKKLVKKAFKMHDEQSHDEKTDLSKLRKGGRAKTAGTVRKYKTGGGVENIIAMDKSAGDKDKIKKVKQTTPAKAEAPSKASVKPVVEGGLNAFCGGRKVK
jgi:hypothetical protein